MKNKKLVIIVTSALIALFIVGIGSYSYFNNEKTKQELIEQKAKNEKLEKEKIALEKAEKEEAKRVAKEKKEAEEIAKVEAEKEQQAKAAEEAEAQQIKAAEEVAQQQSMDSIEQPTEADPEVQQSHQYSSPEEEIYGGLSIAEMKAQEEAMRLAGTFDGNWQYLYRTLYGQEALDAFLQKILNR